jgi:hypothetical protein
MDAIKRRVHEEGVSAISLMPKKVQELSAFISETFTPECVLGGEVPKNLVGSPPQLNEELSAALRTVRAHVANAISSLSAVRRWIVCQVRRIFSCPLWEHEGRMDSELACQSVMPHTHNIFPAATPRPRAQIPPVEDGGNFGVDIQLGVAKEIASEIEKLEKVFDSLPDYHEKVCAQDLSPALARCLPPFAKQRHVRRSVLGHGRR